MSTRGRRAGCGRRTRSPWCRRGCGDKRSAIAVGKSQRPQIARLESFDSIGRVLRHITAIKNCIVHHKQQPRPREDGSAATLMALTNSNTHLR